MPDPGQIIVPDDRPARPCPTCGIPVHWVPAYLTDHAPNVPVTADTVTADADGIRRGDRHIHPRPESRQNRIAARLTRRSTRSAAVSPDPGFGSSQSNPENQ